MTGKSSAPTDFSAPPNESGPPKDQRLRFLSRRWFEKVAECSGTWSEPPTRSLVLEQVVEDTPDGPVRYRVESAGGSSRIIWPVAPGAPEPDIRVTCSWETAVAIASGELIAGQALLDGKLHVRGNPSLIDLPDGGLGTADPLPQEVRRNTSFSLND